ncbi:hypothetical protein COCC4DRAFT_76809 [Bipolaris maydis ATCC 48331]|uniref:Uncharacterized protein n=2 Tax=Cochliobolus heterostrophus TaxID=5016 RepID=M2TV65_COCH5|nr:uncharacterized protein COCC4DRAFT_76809 [Bipolaris maydis ATCC 48331]EMD85656.1 hypothetical protein COCHEDRAFT_1207656 [Bipolaris maydis C5]ENH99085.1 hypothetical protein COCC4DRAFT_76809 [Bipolaris maydis ATCC 48331]KAJ5028924.1 hypothetical protein J3E73DRAFT_422103 [Bipolaris maydis]KAJ6273094.1 hypothetical protein PSV08DRAFT_400649 [Bipolaris maydis]
MDSQETIPDDTLYQNYKKSPVVSDDIVYPALEPKEIESATKGFGNKKSDWQSSECRSRETKKAASYADARHHHRENGSEALDLLGKAVDLLSKARDIIGQQERISNEMHDVFPCLQEVLEQLTRKSLPNSGKNVRWADVRRAYGSDDYTNRPRKRLREDLQG